MGLLDELAKALQEAQEQAEGRRRAPPLPPRPRDDRAEADIEDEEDGDEVVVRRAPPPPRRRPPPVVEEPAPAPPVVPARTVPDSPPALAPHVVAGPQAVDRIRALVGNAASVRDVFIAREILGPPPGLNRWRRGRQGSRRP